MQVNTAEISALTKHTNEGEADKRRQRRQRDGNNISLPLVQSSLGRNRA